MKQYGLLRCPWTEIHSDSRIPACETPPGRGAGPQGRQPARKGGTGWALGAKAGAKTPLLPHSPDRPACQSPRDGQASVSALLRPRAEQLCGQEAGKERLPGKPRLPCDTAEGGGTNGERLGVEGPTGWDRHLVSLALLLSPQGALNTLMGGCPPSQAPRSPLGICRRPPKEEPQRPLAPHWPCAQGRQQTGHQTWFPRAVILPGFPFSASHLLVSVWPGRARLKERSHRNACCCFSSSPEKTHHQNPACATQGRGPTARQLYSLEEGESAQCRASRAAVPRRKAPHHARLCTFY